VTVELEMGGQPISEHVVLLGALLGDQGLQGAPKELMVPLGPARTLSMSRSARAMAGTRQGWREPAERQWRPFAWPLAMFAMLPLWRAVVAQAGRTKQAPALPAELVGILSMRHPGTLLQEMVLDAELAERLAQVISEQRQRHRLEEFGLKPMRKLLLIGPPGTGKTMTAAALAGELGLPLFTIQLDGLISRFLGETAAKLRLVFEGLAQQRGV
jgi:ATP-dependent Zn protease